MKFSYNWLQSYFDKKLPSSDKLAELLTTHSFETEIVRSPTPHKGEESDSVLDIDILPNRMPDCASHLGIAKECGVLLGCKLKDIGYPSQTVGYPISHTFQTKDYISLEVREPELCPRYMALLVKNIKVKESPKWLRERLNSIGQRSINNIVDIGNYVMLETGQPLHAFDLDKLGGRKIVVRKAEQNEFIETLDNQKPVLTKNTLVIADAKDPLAIAGIKGGKGAEITNDTKDIVIEAAIFDPASIRQTSRDVNIKTDASMRFENGVSMFLPESAMQRIAQLMHEIAGGEIAGTTIDFCKTKPKLPRVIFKEEDVEKLIGIKISADKIEKILHSLGFKLSKSNFDSKEVRLLEITPPAERLDINIKEDVIEEIARIYGYENIKPEMPDEVSVPPERNKEYFFANLIRGIFVELGFSEVYNYSFEKIGKLELKNPIASDKKYLRMNLLQGLRLNVVENFKNCDEVKLFEVGKVFDKNLGERTHLAFIVAGKKKSEEDVLQETKGVVDDFLKNLGIAEVGEFDGYIKRNVFECDLDRIIELASENIDIPEIEMGEGIEYKPFSKYPAIIRDISLFVPANTKVVEVMDVIENTAGSFLVDTDLFDIYLPDPKSAEGGSGLGQALKSLAFRLIFQSFEKTLTDKEVNEIMDKIIKVLEENIEWQVRKQ